MVVDVVDTKGCPGLLVVESASCSMYVPDGIDDAAGRGAS